MRRAINWSQYCTCTCTCTLNDILPESEEEDCTLSDDLEVVLTMGGEVVLEITGRVSLMDEGATLNSPSFPSLVACLSMVRTHFSLTVELNFRLKSTIKFPQLQDKHKGIED